MSRVNCDVFGHLLLFRARDPALTNGVNRRQSEQRHISSQETLGPFVEPAICAIPECHTRSAESTRCLLFAFETLLPHNAVRKL